MLDRVSKNVTTMPYDKRDIWMPVGKGQPPASKKEIKEYFELMRAGRVEFLDGLVKFGEAVQAYATK